MIQRFVRTTDLDNVYAAVHRMLAAANVNAMKLETYKYYYVPTGPIGLAGIVAKPTPELLKLQEDLIAAVAPFTVDTGTIDAFTVAHDDPARDAQMITYVSTFVPKQTGDHLVRTSPLASPPGNTSIRCWPNRLSRSVSRLPAPLFTNSARSAQQRRDSRSGSSSLEGASWNKDYETDYMVRHAARPVGHSRTSDSSIYDIT